MKHPPSRMGLLWLIALLNQLTATTHGQTWETVFSTPLTENSNAIARKILLDPFAPPTAVPLRLFVGMDIFLEDLLVVNLSDATSQNRSSETIQGLFDLGFDPSSQNLVALSRYGDWNVRRSTNQGATWDVVDSLASPVGSENLLSQNGPRCFVHDDQGNLYVAGTLQTTSGIPAIFKWVVRKSGDQGSSWQTVHQSPNASGGPGIFVPGTHGGLFVLVHEFSGLDGPAQPRRRNLLATGR